MLIVIQNCINIIIKIFTKDCSIAFRFDSPIHALYGRFLGVSHTSRFAYEMQMKQANHGFYVQI